MEKNENWSGISLINYRALKIGQILITEYNFKIEVGLFKLNKSFSL